MTHAPCSDRPKQATQSQTDAFGYTFASHIHWGDIQWFGRHRDLTDTRRWQLAHGSSRARNPSGSAAYPGLEEGIETFCPMEAARRSAESGQPVEVSLLLAEDVSR